MLSKIKVYGRLAELVGWHVNYADVKTMKDVYKYIACNYPEVEPHLAQNMYRITVNNDVIKPKEDLLIKSEGEIRMIPIVSGAWFWIAAALIGGGLSAAGSIMGGMAQGGTGFFRA